MVRIRIVETSRFVMPSDAELDRLHAIVVALYPPFGLPDDADEQRLFERRRAFRNAFSALGRLGRLAEPERKNVHALVWWLDLCRDWLTQNDVDGDIDGHAFVTALLAHGDIPYLPLTRWPFDLSFGLVYGGAGRPASDAWREVLRTGRLLAPTQPPRSTPSSYPVAQFNLRHAR